MAANSFDPFRAQARYAWRNRWARLRRESAQTAVHGAALLALALLLGTPAWNARASWGAALANLLQQWPGSTWLLAMALMFAVLSARLQALRAAARRDWLAALPIPAARRRRRAGDAVLREAAGFAIAGSVALLAAGSKPMAFVALGGAIAAACGLAACAAWWSGRQAEARRDHATQRGRVAAHDGLREAHDDAARGDRGGVLDANHGDEVPEPSQRAQRSRVEPGAGADGTPGAEGSSAASDRLGAYETQGSHARVAVAGEAESGLVRNDSGVRNAWSSVVADHGAGRLWRWQRLACGVALHGRTLAWGALAWLTVPMGGGLGATLFAGVAGISLALLIGAWRRSLAVLPQAQRWLEAQPLAPARLLRATWAIPGLVLALAIAATTAVLLMLGTPGLALFAALALFAFGALQFAAAAAERRRPARGALAFLVHAALLVGVLQAFAIAAVPLWMVQMTMLLRRAAR